MNSKLNNSTPELRYLCLNSSSKNPSSPCRLSEAKGYIAKEMLSALMQGKQPHVITSSAVKASWSTDGMDTVGRGNSRPVPPRSAVTVRGSERAPSACSVDDPAALMLR
eukprot:sb/3477461/